ncbi:MAG: hypothetical protein EPO43_06465 [Rugosibacter sp.]|nr:MAG: hypothetical protein EPO43_06465 [Rugosibacter sp.]
MIILRLLGRNCPEPLPARRSASRQGSQTAAGREHTQCAQPLTASTPWYGEGNSKTAPSIANKSTDRQAERAGPADPCRAGGVRDQSRMAVIRHEARGVAHEPDGGTPGRQNAAIMILHCPLAVNA